MQVSEEEIRTKRHVVHHLHLHLVFVTKYRKKVFTEQMVERLNPASAFPAACGGVSEHNWDNFWIDDSSRLAARRVNFHFERVCKNFGCRLVNSLKGVSSRMLRREFKELESYYWKGGLWSPSYFIASCGGAPLDVVKEYIRSQ
jgi:putative transposase